MSGVNRYDFLKFGLMVLVLALIWVYYNKDTTELYIFSIVGVVSIFIWIYLELKKEKNETS